MIDVISYLESKGLTPRHASGNNVNVQCVFCDESPGKRGRLYISLGPPEEEAGLFFCHLCGKKGNIVTLKRHFGDPVEKQEEEDSAVRSLVLEQAALYYHSCLADNVEALRWLKNERGLTRETIIKHQIGWAGGGLWAHLRDQGFRTTDIKNTGLLYEDRMNSELTDFLKNVITIPYHSAGNVVMIRGKEIGGKYLTPPGQKTRLYNSDVTWGAEEVVVTEGELDALVVEQLGFAVVGVPGANTWQNHWDDYFIDAKRVYLVFDNDEAGKTGAGKVQSRLGHKARIVAMPEPEPGHPKNDPSEWIGKQGHSRDEFVDLLKTSFGALLVSVEAAYDEWLEIQGLPGLKFGYPLLDEVLKPGLLPNQVAVLLSKTNCLAGDTSIAVNRAGKGFVVPIQTMCERWNGGRYGWDRSIPTRVQRAENGVVRLVDVVDVWESGERFTYTLTTDSGRTVRASAEHPFQTPEGFVKLADLRVGSEVLVNAGRSRRGKKKRPPYRQRGGLRLHPHATRRNLATGGWTVQTHRLVVEAEINKLDLESFLDRCRNGPVHGIRFIDPKLAEVHHKDGNPQNNSPSNLQLLTKGEHDALHSQPHHVLEQIGAEVVTSIEPYGLEITYDIEVADEPRNFLANGFSVHNTGKTLMLLNMFQNITREQPDARILFVSLEQTRGDWFERALRIFAFHNMDLVEFEKETIEYWRDRIMIVDKNRISEEQLITCIDDYEHLTGGKPDLVAVDYLGYWAASATGKDRYEKVTNAIMSLKAVSKDKLVPIIAPHQVNRMAEFGKEPDLDSARDSGAVEETADLAMLMWSPDNTKGKPQEEFDYEIHIKLGKTRSGGKGNVIKFQFAPVSLAIVPLYDPLAKFAKRERQFVNENFRQLIYRHRSGVYAGEVDLEALSV